MIERIYPRKVICRGRKRPSTLYILTIVLLGLACLLGTAMQKAQATRNVAMSRGLEPHKGHQDIAGSVTLGEMIALQRSKRAQAALPPAPSADVATATVGRWEAQFGAFAGASAAHRLQARLQAHAFGGEIAIANIAGLHRVRSVAADRPAVERLCQSARAADFACFVREL